jgi:hypothetical protein
MEVPALHTVWRSDQFQQLLYKRWASRAPGDCMFMSPPVEAGQALRWSLPFVLLELELLQ